MMRQRTHLGLVGLCALVLACGTVAPSPSPQLGSPEGPTPAPTPTPTLQPSATPSPNPTPTVAPSPLEPGGLRIERTLTYAHEDPEDCGLRTQVCMQFVDVYAPAGAGPWPVAVLFHGRPRRVRDMEPLARAIAERGAVVFNADYRGVRPVVQRGWPIAVEDVACAVRYARANAHLYGGDPATLVVVGHSFGSYLGPLVALAGDEFDGDCLYGADEVSALPTGYIGIAGNYLVEPDGLWNTFYGGSPALAPDAWEMGEFRNHIGGNPDLRVRMVHERGDPIIPPRHPRRFHAALSDAGYDIELTMIAGNEHFALLDPDGNGALVVAFVLELLGLAE